MSKMRNWKILLLLLFCFTGLVGCTREKIIDKLSIIHVFGIDIDENDQQLIATTLHPDYTESKSSKDIKYLMEKAPSGALFPQKLDMYTDTPIRLSKIRVLVLGKKYAESGVQDMVDRFVTNPEIGTNIQIIVSEQSAQQTLTTIKNEGTLTLADKLRQNMKEHHLPNVNLHIFLNHFYGEGMDPFVPMVAIHDDKTVKVSGIGIFQGDKFKLQLDEKETFLFSILEDYAAEGMYAIESEGNDRKEMIVIRGHRSKTNWDLNKSGEGRELKLTLDLKWTVTQHPRRLNLSKVQDIQLLKELIASDVKTGIEDLLQKFKENEVDPLGIGNIVRARDRQWDRDSFYKEYPNFPINVEVNLEIIHTGLEA